MRPVAAVLRYNLDGQLEHMVGFDEDQLRPALDELNRLDLEMSDLQRRATVSALYDGVAWSGRFDPEGHFMRPDVTWIDHRHLAFNSDGLAEIVERNRQLHELVPDLHLFVEQIGLVEPPLFAGTIAYRGTTVEGAIIDDGYAAVLQIDAPTGLIARAISRSQRYRHRQPASRRTRRRPRPDSPDSTMRSTPAGGRTLLRMRATSGRFVERLHPDFTATLLDGRIVDRESLAAGDVAPIAVGFGTADRTLLAIRDDRLALIEIADRIDGVRHRRFAVEEICDDDLVVASTQFGGDRCEDTL